MLCPGNILPAFSADELIIQQASANGTRSLKPFTVQDGWELRWDLTGQAIEVYLNQPDGEPVELQPMASQKNPGSGSTFYPRGGSYYLRIVADGDWTVTVVQLEKDSTPASASGPPRSNHSPAALSIRDFSWSRSRYGSLFVIFTVENPGETEVKDFTISCSAYGRNGEEIGIARKRFSELIPPKSSREYEGVEIGSIHPQAYRIRCKATETHP